ncbi:MAG TPA: HAD hydrolase family protein [Gammaproteobacteria bacterium]|jgi:3-deoxy-D-manno-octulosonate 8-phosphate phosphatase (KDO 8-P phosphatase)|nr:HAD hydrolase family protein [Gammaproteobacteria bacterium]
MPITKKAKLIRLLILDIDGVLTSGTLFYGANGIELNGFHIHDGVGIQLLQKCGIAVAVISGKKSESAVRRMQDLRIPHVYLGQDDKLPAYEELKQKLQLVDEQIAYIGDDLPDLPILQRVGLAVTVPQAPLALRERVDLITKNNGGNGAVREICELIMTAQDHYETMLQSYLDQ